MGQLRMGCRLLAIDREKNDDSLGQTTAGPSWARGAERAYDASAIGMLFGFLRRGTPKSVYWGQNYAGAPGSPCAVAVSVDYRPLYLEEPRTPRTTRPAQSGELRP